LSGLRTAPASVPLAAVDATTMRPAATAAIPGSVHQLQIEEREGGTGKLVWVDDRKASAWDWSSRSP